MSVYKRNYRLENKLNPNGREVWAYSFVHRKVRYREAGFKNKREAVLGEEIARKKVILEGRILKPFETRQFSEAGEEAINIRESDHSPITIKCEKRRLTVLNRYFGSKYVHMLNVADISWFIKQRQKEGLLNRAINLDLNLIRVIMAHAMKYHYATFDPMSEIKNLKEVQKKRPTISADDFNRLIQEAKKLPNSLHLVTWLMVRGYTAVRPTEAVFLEWQDIDWKLRQIVIMPKEGPKEADRNDLKDGEYRYIPIHDDLYAALVEWRKEWERLQEEHGFKHDWVFIHPTNPHERARGFRRSFERACKNAGVPSRSYQFRSFMLSQAVMSGCDLMAVSAWAGHSGVRVLEKHYLHLVPKYQAGEMAKIKFGKAK